MSTKIILTSSWFDTLLGPMLAISNKEKLYLLEFAERRNLDQRIERLKTKLKATIISDRSDPIDSIKNEIESYFSGTLKTFRTPFLTIGSPFQKITWEALIKIPYGETKSYLEQANIINNPSAHRAVANANGSNNLAIIIPCHRILRSNGDLGGYAGGVHRKKWLIAHENHCKSTIHP
jgi:AraC family transcriptional regulator, regulatory protein of adaptative response / methylated-DNA-[protein]-cysteine methyltransferase